MVIEIKEKSYYFWSHNNLTLHLQIQPKANQNAIIGEYNNRLKITLTAAPTSGKANNHLIKFLAKHFGVPQKQVEIIKGHKSRYKSVLVSKPKNNIDNFPQTS